MDQFETTRNLTEDIRQRLAAQGWVMREKPVRSGDQVLRWNLYASKRDRTITSNGNTLFEAFQNLGRMLGVIAK